jgi:hypothetical protein
MKAMETGVDRATYFSIRSQLETNLNTILEMEKKYMTSLATAIESVANNISEDFSKATEFIPFWINYPPLQRGRAPTGKSIPWLEVGETVIGSHVIRAIAKQDPNIMHPGLPSGADIRFMTQEALVHLDIKITGPNDRADEIVASPNQISGDGSQWENDGVVNSPVKVKGQRATMTFQPELSPFYVFEGKKILCLTYFLKGVYTVESLGHQPLDYLELICAPNGLLAFTGPNYNSSTKGLYIPGKDEKTHGCGYFAF